MSLAAVAAGVTPLLAPAYDDFRNWVLDGAPDLGAAAVRIEREPDPKGSDAERQHTVLLEEDAGQLEALIQYYGAYHVRVKIGNAVGLEGPWARRFPIERTNGPLPGIDEPRQGHAQTPCAPDPQL